MEEKELFDAVEPRNSIDYMLRTLHQNNVQLIKIADQKANILIGLTAIVLTLLLCKLGSDQLYLPLIVFGICAVGASLFALFTLLPRIGQKGGGEEISEPSELLLFTRISKLDRSDYLQRMDAMLKHDKYVYSALVGDIHSQGNVLARKYKFLSLSYLTLAGGIFVAVALGLGQLFGLVPIG